MIKTKVFTIIDMTQNSPNPFILLPRENHGIVSDPFSVYITQYYFCKQLFPFNYIDVCMVNMNVIYHFKGCILFHLGIRNNYVIIL